jgi:hypothetical protein
LVSEIRKDMLKTKACANKLLLFMIRLWGFGVCRRELE